MVDPIRVLVVDDHELVRAGLRRLLEDIDGIEHVGEAADGRTVAEMVARLDPDVVLLDVSMPGLNGLSALTKVATGSSRVRVVMLSMHANEHYVWQALHAGAAGYVLKDSSPAELELAIRSVAAGGTYLTPAVSRHIVDAYVGRVQPANGPLDQLTPRQIEILQLVSEGSTNHQIAAALGISLKTVETHRAALMQTLSVHDVTGLVRYAIRTGLVSPNG